MNYTAATPTGKKHHPLPTPKSKAAQTDPKIHVRPTRFGHTFLFILAAMLVGSLNSNNNLGFLLTFLLGSMAAVSIWHTRRNLAGIKLTYIRAKPVFAGETAHFEVSLQKTDPAARAIDVRLTAEHPSSIDRVDASPASVTVGIPTGRRGLLTPEPVELSTCYPFGLFKARVNLSHSAGCLVYPRPIDGSLKTVPGEPVTGTGSGQSGTGVDDFAGLKPYQPGDSLGQISWKAFSRGQGLLIKQFTGEAGRMLTIDWHAVKEPNLERKLSRMCGMVLNAHQAGLQFGLRLPKVAVTPARGENHLRACLAHLALFGLPGGTAASASFSGPRPSKPDDSRFASRQEVS